jgi:hypothetical protein
MQTVERAIVLLVLDRERSLDELGRIVGPDALAAAKTLAADGAVVRHGELLWASSCVSRLDELRLIAV